MKSQTLNTAITDLESCPAAWQYGADKLKGALLTEESL